MLHLCSMNVQSVERIRSRRVEYQAICSTANVARSLASLSRSLPQHCWLCLRASLRSFARSLAHSLASGLMGKIFLSMNRTLRFCTISNHNVLLLHILSLLGNTVQRSIGRSVGRSISQSVGRSVGWLVHWSVCPSIDPLLL